jgi:hypothetical protein
LPALSWRQQTPTLEHPPLLCLDHIEQRKRKATHFTIDPIITPMPPKAVTCPALILLR